MLGKGKLDDVIVRAMQLDAEMLIFDRNLTPVAGRRAIAKKSDLKVIDRTQLILDIFAQRAESKDGKLQVELAQLKYTMPRLAQKDDSLSRLTGGIGGRGPGETKLEIGRRRAKERVSAPRGAAEEARSSSASSAARKRTRDGVPTVAIVGYTNAGKSTLLNTLTGADVLAEDKLFATLDTRSRMLKVGWAGYGDREVVITDTVGFIRDLPKDLFAAFRATFEEAADADLLLHVVDASDDAKDEHIETTEKVLAELELDDDPAHRSSSTRPTCSTTSRRRRSRTRTRTAVRRVRDAARDARGRSSSASRASSPSRWDRRGEDAAQRGRAPGRRGRAPRDGGRPTSTS